MLAIVNLNGKQYQVQEGRYIEVDHLSQAPDEVVEIGNVLMIIDGEQTRVGAPFVEGATVQAKVLSHSRGPKVIVYKMRCKKGYRRKNGHRQDFTRLQIVGIDFPGKKAGEKSTAEKPASSKAKKSSEAATDAAPEAQQAS